MIYVAEAVGMNIVKIGHSKNGFAARRTTLQTGCPAPLVLRHEFEGGSECEQIMHFLFAEKRVYGEWFSVEADVVNESFMAIKERIDRVRLLKKLNGEELAVILMEFSGDDLRQTLINAVVSDDFEAIYKTCFEYRDLKKKGMKRIQLTLEDDTLEVIDEINGGGNRSATIESLLWRLKVVRDVAKRLKIEKPTRTKHGRLSNEELAAE